MPQREKEAETDEVSRPGAAGEGDSDAPHAVIDAEITDETVVPSDEDVTDEMTVGEAVTPVGTEPIPFPAADLATGGDGAASDETTGAVAVAPARLESIVESLLFASDRPLGLAELKRLLGERDGKKVTAAVETLQARRAGTGVIVTSAAGGWQLRTNPDNAAWVGKLLAGRPVRLSRATLETLSIVAYRQPVTRPEIDEIRGVDCGPVLKTLLDRGLIRIIGKKEEVGRPLLYGTTPEFLLTFSLRDLTELPTLREFHELGREEQAAVDAEQPGGQDAADSRPAQAPPAFTPGPPLPAEPEEDDGLLDDLDRAAQAAARATGAVESTARDETARTAVTDELGAAGGMPDEQER
jgi:segregation and condensation protein B